MKKTYKIILGILFVGIILVFLNLNSNYFKLKDIEEQAINYIRNIYNTSEPNEVSVHRERGSDYYVVNYSDEYGSYLLVYDRYRKLSFWNEFLEEKVKSIIVNYGDVRVFAEKRSYDKDRTNHLVLKGADKDTIIGSVVIFGTETATATTLAEVAKELYIKVFDKGLPIDKWKFTLLNAADYSTLEITCPDNMSELSISDIEELIVK